MKANELMIGDWVQNTCGHKGRVIGFRYDAYDEYNEIVIAYHHNSTSWSNPTLIEPIKITNGILANNELLGEIKVSVNASFSCEEMSYERGYFLFTYRYAGDVKIKLVFEFVHELQHVLRLCGLDELADNFKVEGGEA